MMKMTGSKADSDSHRSIRGGGYCGRAQLGWRKKGGKFESPSPPPSFSKAFVSYCSLFRPPTIMEDDRLPQNSTETSQFTAHAGQLPFRILGNSKTSRHETCVAFCPSRLAFPFKCFLPYLGRWVRIVLEHPAWMPTGLGRGFPMFTSQMFADSLWSPGSSCRVGLLLVLY